jgi:DNA-binding response OmpR family regulator
LHDRDAQRPAQQPHNRPQRGTETILLAEDQELVRGLTARLLKSAGYAVLAAADGEEALHLFRENADTIDLLVLDAVMPKLTGRQVCRAVRELRPEAKVIFCTGYDPETAQPRGVIEEDVRWIDKPFTAETLLAAVREVLDRPPQPQLAGSAIE